MASTGSVSVGTVVVAGNGNITAGNLSISANASIGNANITGTANIGNVSMASTGSVSVGTVVVAGNGNITAGNLSISANASIGNANITGTANIGNISMAAAGNITIGSVVVAGNGNITAGNITVTGNTYNAGNVGIGKNNATCILDVSGTANIAGNTNITGTTNISGGYLGVYGISENIVSIPWAANANISYSSGAIYYITGGSANITQLNISNIPTNTVGKSYVVSLIMPKTGTAYFANITNSSNSFTNAGNINISGITLNGSPNIVNYSGGYTNVSLTSANTVVQSFILIGNTTNAGNISGIISSVNTYY